MRHHGGSAPGAWGPAPGTPQGVSTAPAPPDRAYGLWPTASA